MPTPKKLPKGIRRLPSGAYQARWTNLDGSPGNFTSTDYNAVVAELARARRAKSQQAPYEPAVLQRPLGAFLNDYLQHLKTQDRAPATYQGNQATWNRHIAPVLAGRPVGAITKAEMRAFVAELQAKGYGGSTIVDILGIVAQTIDRAYETANVLDRANPARKLGVQREHRQREMLPLSAEQVEALAVAVARPLYSGARSDGPGPEIRRRLAAGERPVDICNALGVGSGLIAYHRKAMASERLQPGRRHEQYSLFIRLQVSTGLRPGEMIALRPCDFAPDFATVKVAWALATVNKEITEELGLGSSVHRKSTKNRSVRTVPIRHSLRAEIAALAAQRESPEDTLFQSPEGGPMNLANFKNRFFKPAAVSIGMPDLILYDLRHTFASTLARMKVDIADVSKLMGHSSFKITADVYQHFFNDTHEALATVLDGAFAVGEPVAPVILLRA